jgi:hypothetical protein
VIYKQTYVKSITEEERLILTKWPDISLTIMTADEPTKIVQGPSCDCQSPRDTNRCKRKNRRRPKLTGVSKQRKSANERERNRIKIVNAAFESLRDVIPVRPMEKKPSKIETIRLAVRYIQDMTDLLISACAAEDT